MGKTGTPRRKDLSGQTFNELTVVEFAYIKSEQAHWKCKCVCAKEVIVRADLLKQGRQKSCSLECQYKRKAESHIGETHGQLTILGIDFAAMENNEQYWYKLECSCGEILSSQSTLVLTGKKLTCSGVCTNVALHNSYIGMRFGRLEVLNTCIIQEGGKIDNPRTGFLCKCDCGVEIKRRVHHIKTGMIKSCGCLQTDYGNSLIGDKNPNWDNDATTEGQRARTCKAYFVWQNEVFDRDGWSCQKCKYYNKRGESLTAHHIQNFSSHHELRYEKSNGISLCGDCHRSFHSKYSVRNNTREQIAEFLESTSI